MKILHLGSFSSQHTQMAYYAYQTLGYDAIFVNIKKDCLSTNIVGCNNKFLEINPFIQSTRGNLIDRLTPKSIAYHLNLMLRYVGFHDKDFVDVFKEIESKYEIDVVVGTWGYPVLEAMLLAQKIFNTKKFVHNILTIPDLPVIDQGLKGVYWKIFIGIYNYFLHYSYKKMLARCDLRIHASEAMLKFTSNKYSIESHGLDIVQIERFNFRYFPTKRLAKISQFDSQPHIVHIGATNFLTGSPIDNVGVALKKLSENKINVHLSVAPNSKKFNADNKYLHYFNIFDSNSDPKIFSEFLTQFDAIIIIYNVNQVYDRFVCSLPTRFLFALVVGVPVVVPAGLFPACESYISHHGIGFSYNNEAELFEILMNKKTMQSYRVNANLHSEGISFDKSAANYDNLFKNLLLG